MGKCFFSPSRQPGATRSPDTRENTWPHLEKIIACLACVPSPFLCVCFSANIFDVDTRCTTTLVIPYIEFPIVILWPGMLKSSSDSENINLWKLYSPFWDTATPIPVFQGYFSKFLMNTLIDAQRPHSNTPEPQKLLKLVKYSAVISSVRFVLGLGHIGLQILGLNWNVCIPSVLGFNWGPI